MVLVSLTATSWIMSGQIAANAQVKPQYGGTLRLADLNTYEMTKWITHQVGGQFKLNYFGRVMWERLVTFNENWEFAPELATDWSTPDGGKTWVFHLVRNATWHDGTKFTSADVKFNYDAMTNRTWPKTKIPAIITEGYKVLSAVESVTTPDDYTVQFNCYKPLPLDGVLELSLSGMICMPKHIFEGTDINKNPALLAPIGTGPFKFVKHVQAVYIEFEKNKNYWRQGKPYLDKIIERLYSTPESAIIALEAGELDYIQDGIYIAPAEIARLRKDPKYGAGGYTYPNTIRLRLNLHETNLQKYPALSNTQVRRALSYAINRKAMCNDIFLGLTTPNNQFYSISQKWLRPPDVKDHPYDPEQARQMLDKAGYPVKSDGWRFDIGQIVSYPQYINAAELIKANFDAIQVKSAIRAMEMVAIIDKLERGPEGLNTVPDVSMLLQTEGVGPAPDVVSRQLHSKALAPREYNAGFYKSQKMDALLDAATTKILDRDRQEAYWAVARQFDEDLPLIVLCDKFRTFVWREYVRGPPKELLPQAYFTRFDNIWISTPPVTTTTTRTTPTTTTTPAPAIDLTVVAPIVVLVIVVAVVALRFRKPKKSE
jgi:peptide/nickel transport system substrate-binding protein